MHQCFIQDPKRYTDHFSWLLTRPRFRGGQSRLTDDITPSYAVLNAETLGEIKTNFEQCGIPVKPVFLMREPLERLISSQRMKLRKQDLRDPASEVETLRHRVAKGLCLRGDYGQTLDALDEAFGLEHCFIGLFETLFTPEIYTQLCSFLGISFEKPIWAEKNFSTSSTVIPDDLLATMGHVHANKLRRAIETPPNTDFQTLWLTASRC